MSKKLKIILVGLVVLVLGILGGYFFILFRNGKTSGTTTTLKKIDLQSELVAGDLVYNDASGFSFGYPQSLKVNDVTPSDEVYYTQLNLVKGGQKLVVTVRDTEAKNVDEFIKGDFAYEKASLSGAVSLGGVSAKQYTTENKLITAAIDDGVLYLIESPKDGSFWEEVQNLVISSFNFGLKNSASGDSGVIYEEEEVVE